MTVATNAIDLDTNKNRFCGIITFDTTATLQTISNPAEGPAEIMLKPDSGVNLTVNDSGNIDFQTGSNSVVLNGTNGDYQILRKSPTTGNYVEYITAQY